jgi:hypothetical protein
MSEWIAYEKDSLPEPYKSIVIMDSNGHETEFCYRCGHHPDCKEIRSDFGGGLMIFPVKWRYKWI